MSEYAVPDYGCVTNIKVYGLDESIKRAKYPLSVDVNSLNEEITNGIMSLATSKPGEGHDQFETSIVVQFDLTFTNKAWIEIERYSNISFCSSQSTIHRIAKFDLDKQYSEYTDPRSIAIVKELVDKYNETKDKEDYLRVLMSNPAGFKLTAGMTTNYRQLKIVYNQRKNHKLPEWREFCRWIETLPHSELIIGNGKC